MKHNSAIKYSWVYIWLVSDAFMVVNGLALPPTNPLPKWNLGPPNTEGPPEIWNFPAPSYKIQKK